ncbi:type II secretion system F family protein [Zooshikella ganghwensis]|uniref:type II secretion system F family protein n=1 Tax=Zooshikella ganghwensis TaxID=202772 RepID=UPI00146FAD6B|nr:type II secretion system F family protein [Zooshikella ganghwensis]
MVKRTNKINKRPLSTEDLAKFYFQLSRLEESGISVEQAFKLFITNKGELSKRSSIALSEIKKGQPLSKAGKKAGLISNKDAYIIEVAESGGVQNIIYRELATVYQDRLKNIKQIKSRLALPLFIVICAVFIKNFPDFFLGRISFFEYLFDNIANLLILFLSIYTAFKLPDWVRNGPLSFLQQGWDIITTRTPYISDWYIRSNIRDFIQSLGLLTRAGLPILEAIPKSYNILDNKLLKNQLKEIDTNLQKGDSFSQALSTISIINPEIKQIISTGEYSGDLSGALLHCAKSEAENIAIHTNTMVDWIPRIVYFTVICWIAYGIIQGGPPIGYIESP